MRTDRRTFLRAIGLLAVARPSSADDDCPGFVIATGRLEAAEHEIAEGYAVINHVTIKVPEDSVNRRVLADHLNESFDLVLRPQQKRERERISR